ncbi:LOW QUALITY PROTEIN: Crinkler (CRN) [Phytophthora megakarya]|uniref:Crinkler (CRN) n=1 Tax=Phytophthora megakarya TaxID=4795 RepID=A0A225VTK8_9STRA|nr:LOW QUALITY PROTEIN: Crinkler (CRN) [Phytophthora megakarya]
MLDWIVEIWVNDAEQAAGKGHVHILAVVPDASNDGVFKVCGDPFFSQFPTVDEVNGWLQFPTLLPLTEHQMLYVRSSYKSIADQALSKVDQNRRKYAIIAGTPGIGKSVFVYYVMWRLIKEKKRVLLFDSVGTFYFDSTTMLTCSTLPDKSNLKFWSTDLWCLVDSLDPTGITALPYLRCSILLASTPRRDYIGEFRKLVPTPVVLYMPLWTKEELGAIVHLYPKALGK